MTILLMLACAAAEPPTEPVFLGMCDASGAWRAPNGELWVADDEHPKVNIYAATGGPPLRQLDLGLGDEEVDLEGVAALGDRIWWIASHGRNKDAEPRPARQILLATTTDGTPVGRTSALLPALLASPELGPLLTAAEPRAPKEGGIAIEGLGAADGALWIGFRSPLDAEGRALIVRLDAPDALLAGGPVVIGAVEHLALHGRGIRSLERDGNGWYLVAGSPGSGDSSGLYSWFGPGARPILHPVVLKDLNPEALLVLPNARLEVLSDDGTRPIGGQPCKSLDVAQQSFRGRILDTREFRVPARRSP